MNVVYKTLAPGVELNYVHATKFKSSVLSMQLAVPLAAETVTSNALVPAVLMRGTKQFPTMGALNAQMDRLYGAQVEYTKRRIGEVYCIGFTGYFIDDRFTLAGDKLLAPVASLMGQLLTDPVLEGDGFSQSYVKGEQKNLSDGIASIIDNKQTYASLRLIQEMCEGERFGVSQYGLAEMVAQSDAQSLYRDYQDLVATAPIQVFYGGSASQEAVEQAVMEALSGLQRNYQGVTLSTAPHILRAAPKVVTESLDVTQGKLGLGFACPNVDHNVLQVGNSLFGGSSNAKLFMNVREKLSLCYYASSGYNRDKNIITLASGIEFEKYQAVCDECIAQLQAVAKGDWEDWEWESVHSAARAFFHSVEDSLRTMEGVCMVQAINGQRETPAETLEKLLAVTPEQVMAAMSGVALDTTYFLKGKD